MAIYIFIIAAISNVAISCLKMRDSAQ